MVDNPVWEICERVAEVQALLDDHVAGGKHSAADVVAKAQAKVTHGCTIPDCGTNAGMPRLYPLGQNEHKGVFRGS